MSSKYYLKILLSVGGLIFHQGEEVLVHLKARISAQCLPDDIAFNFSYEAQVPLTIARKHGPEWVLWESRMYFYLRGIDAYSDAFSVYLAIEDRNAPQAVHLLKLGLAEFCQAYGIELIIHQDTKLQAFMQRHIVT